MCSSAISRCGDQNPDLRCLECVSRNYRKYVKSYAPKRFLFIFLFPHKLSKNKAPKNQGYRQQGDIQQIYRYRYTARNSPEFEENFSSQLCKMLFTPSPFYDKNRSKTPNICPNVNVTILYPPCKTPNVCPESHTTSTPCNEKMFVSDLNLHTDGAMDFPPPDGYC